MKVTPNRNAVAVPCSDERQAPRKRGPAAEGMEQCEVAPRVVARETKGLIADCCFFNLDEAAYRRFVELLDAAPSANPRLVSLLTKPAPWEHGQR